MVDTNCTDLADVQRLQADDRITTRDVYGIGRTGRLERIEVNLSPSVNAYIVYFANGEKQYASTIELAD